MSRLPKLAAVSSVLLVSSMIVGAAPNATAAAIVVTGTVRDAQGTPIQGLRVKIGQTVVPSAPDGSFSIPASGSGKQVLRVVNRGTAGAFPSWFRLRWPAATFASGDTIDVTLPEATQQEITVVDQHGAPAALGSSFSCCDNTSRGATPWERAASGGTASGLGTASVDQYLLGGFTGTTRWLFPDPVYFGLRVHGQPTQPPGVSSTTWLHQELSGTAVGDGPTLTLPLPRTELLRLTAETPDGDPAAVNVRLTSPNGGAVAETENGTLLAQVPRGANHIEIQDRSRYPASPLWTATGDRDVLERTRWDLKVPAITTSQFHVKDADGSPATDTTVALNSGNPVSVDGGLTMTGGQDLHLTGTVSADTNRHGNASLTSLTQIRLTNVLVSRFGNVDGDPATSIIEWRRVSILKPQTTPVNVTLPGAGRLTAAVQIPNDWISAIKVTTEATGVRGQDVAVSEQNPVLVPVGFHDASVSVRSSSQGAIGSCGPDSFRARTSLTVAAAAAVKTLRLPRSVTLSVRLIDRRGDPVHDHQLVTANREVADRVEFFTGLGKAHVVQALASDSTGPRGRACVQAFPDSDIDRLVVRDPHTGQVLAVVRHVDLSTDRSIKVVVGTADNPTYLSARR